MTSTFVAHQKLATLSSNRPRENGKMRVIGSKIANLDVDGETGSHGANMTKKVAAVTMKRRMNNLELFQVSAVT